jgi:hypothetical protein
LDRPVEKAGLVSVVLDFNRLLNNSIGYRNGAEAESSITPVNVVMSDKATGRVLASHMEFDSYNADVLEKVWVKRLCAMGVSRRPFEGGSISQTRERGKKIPASIGQLNFCQTPPLPA